MLTAADVCALPNSVVVPSALSDVTDDSAQTPIARARCDMYGNVISDAYVKKTDDLICGATPITVANGNNIILDANKYTVITISENTAIALGTGVSGFNNYWQAQITQPQTAYQITLPASVVWDNDCAPVMDANSTCIITFWFIGSVLHACFD